MGLFMRRGVIDRSMDQEGFFFLQRLSLCDSLSSSIGVSMSFIYYVIPLSLPFFLFNVILLGIHIHLL